MIPTDSLANRLVLIRRELGLSQREAAQRCGVGFGSWQSWENGSAPRNALRDLVRVAQGLDVDREWLMFGGPLRSEMVEPARPHLSSAIPGNMRDDLPSTAEVKALRKRIPLQLPTSVQAGDTRFGPRKRWRGQPENGMQQEQSLGPPATAGLGERGHCLHRLEPLLRLVAA
jgi:transcriptional regulator with XRE-family HTH domain